MSSSDAPEEEFYEASFYSTLHTSSLIINDKNIKYDLAISNPRDLIRFAENFPWNRPINNEHVKGIIKDLKEMASKPFILGTFKILFDSKKNRYMIFDGQHRFEAFKSIMEEDIEHIWNIPTTLEIFTLPPENCNIENNPIAIKLFELANKTHAFDKINDNINTYIQDISNAFENEPLFKNAIGNSRCSKPKISKDTVYQILKKCFNPLIKPTVSEVIKILLKKNNIYSNSPIKDIIGVSKPTTQYNKAREIVFFLNLKLKDDQGDVIKPFERRIKEIVLELNNKV